jgi:hypothetical protein
MPEFANPVPLGLEEAGRSPPAAPVAEEPIREDLLDYVTPPPRKVITVAVRYGEVRKGLPLPYDLAEVDAEP